MARKLRQNQSGRNWAWSAASCQSSGQFEQRVFHGSRARLWTGGCRPKALQFWEEQVGFLGYSLALLLLSPSHLFLCFALLPGLSFLTSCRACFIHLCLSHRAQHIVCLDMFFELMKILPPGSSFLFHVLPHFLTGDSESVSHLLREDIGVESAE